MGFTCDARDPTAPAWVKKICSNIRWVPVVFIVCLLAYGSLTITISLGVQYHLVHKGRWGTALSEIIASTILAGGAIWGFVVAVFKNPGSPLSHGRDHESWGTTDAGRPVSEYELEHGEEIQSLMETDAARLGKRRGNDEDSARASLLDAPIPGQPQYPARSGREQLDDLQRLHRQSVLGIETRENLWVKSSGEPRWCNKCGAPKPDRAHHCSTCRRCVLRMDHHCPWLANRCVGLRNHKGFFLFLVYTALFCFYACQETGRALLSYVENETNGFETSPLSWAVVFFLAFIFGASLIPFAGYHAWLICKNRTTIESMEGSGRVRLRTRPTPNRTKVEDRLRNIIARASTDDNSQQDLSSRQSAHLSPPAGRGERGSKQEAPSWRPDEHLSRDERRALRRASKLNVYDVGVGNNWRQIMGRRWWLWFVPVGEPEGDGFSFLVNIATLQRLEEVTASVRVRDEAASRSAGAPHTRGGSHPSVEGHSAQRYSTDSDGDESVYGRGSLEATRFGHRQRATSQDSAEGRQGPADARARSSRRTFQGAHGEMEWGEAPKKSFVLYGVDDDSDAEHVMPSTDHLQAWDTGSHSPSPPPNRRDISAYL